MSTHQPCNAAASALTTGAIFSCADFSALPFAAAAARREHSCALHARFDRTGLRRR